VAGSTYRNAWSGCLQSSIGEHDKQCGVSESAPLPHRIGLAREASDESIPCRHPTIVGDPALDDRNVGIAEVVIDPLELMRLLSIALRVHSEAISRASLLDGREPGEWEARRGPTAESRLAGPKP
jgi:hypothetical protein